MARHTTKSLHTGAKDCSCVGNMGHDIAERSTQDFPPSPEEAL